MVPMRKICARPREDLRLVWMFHKFLTKSIIEMV